MILPITEREGPAMTQQQRIAYWQDLVEAQSQSGLDVTTFHGYSLMRLCRDMQQLFGYMEICLDKYIL